MLRRVPSLHRAAQVGFDAGAEAYERGRPGFPHEAARRLAAELEIRPGRRLVDLAAGTGKLTRLLVPFGARLVAVEPVDGMRRKLSQTVPGVPVVAGVAEALPLGSGSLDAVTVAQAFHWFHPERALAELHRVLRPSGRLGLVWNVRDESSRISSAMTAIFDRYRRDAPTYRDRAWERAFAETELFTPLRTATFSHEQHLARRRSFSRTGARSPGASGHRDGSASRRRSFDRPPVTAW